MKYRVGAWLTGILAIVVAAASAAPSELSARVTGESQGSVQHLNAGSFLQGEATLAKPGISELTDAAIASHAVNPAIAASVPWSSADGVGIRESKENLGVADAACQPGGNGDFRVASGAVSSRWVYEIWQNIDTFYVKYWRQSQSCAQALRTGGFATPQEARQYILDTLKLR